MKWQIQQKMKPYTLLHYKFSKTLNENYTFSKQASIHFFVLDYFKVWDRRQLNPIYICRIISFHAIGSRKAWYRPNMESRSTRCSSRWLQHQIWCKVFETWGNYKLCKYVFSKQGGSKGFHGNPLMVGLYCYYYLTLQCPALKAWQQHVDLDLWIIPT